MLSLFIPILKYLSCSSLRSPPHKVAIYRNTWLQWQVFRFSLWYAATDTKDCEYFTNQQRQTKPKWYLKKHEAFTITLNYSLPLKFCELLFDNSPLKWHFFFKISLVYSTYQFRFNCKRTKGTNFWVIFICELVFPMSQRGWKEHDWYTGLLINP